MCKEKLLTGLMGKKKKSSPSSLICFSQSCRLSRVSVFFQHLLLHFTLLSFYSHALLNNKPQQHKTSASSRDSTG